MLGKKNFIEIADGVTYAVIDEGTGPGALLLHGFPDSSYLWRHQIPVLVDAGFRVIAPDLRGFGESSKPHAVEAYKLRTIIGDLTTLMRKLDVGRAHVVGHDWGAVLSWVLASIAPSHVDHLCTMTIAHPSIFNRPTSEERGRRSYMDLYQHEGLAEDTMRRDNWALLRETVGDERDFAVWIESFERPGALRAALNWYRANKPGDATADRGRQLPNIAAPTLALWGTKDPTENEEPMMRSAQFVRGHWEFHRVEGAGHWIPVDAPDRVNELLLGFLGQHASASSPARSRRRY
jgi:pimeloyl-ACP methyl ester carboxylesterase